MIGEDLCNITNASTAMGTDDEAVPLSRKYYSSQAEFTLPMLQQFGIGQTIDFFHVLGLPLTKLKEGLMYPISLQAASGGYFRACSRGAEHSGIYLNNKVLDVTVSADHPRFKITCRTETEEQVVYTNEYLFICTGGLTGQNAGPDGSGYTIAQQMGIPWWSLFRPSCN